ncbi:ribosome-associated translation inhibitor RaiA [bacterium]|nr:ribosome-associated translation inhibitor RaiA [bacterium]QQR57876.1 MAG: ribosome-associated translation inhibitor RaiA [Candidatus Melainabacteria bacterium]
MQVTVTGRNIEVTSALKDYLSDKLQRAQKHFEHDFDCKALLSVSKNPSVARSQTAEITINLHGQIIRGEESTENMYASIDLVADKVERQLRKYKTRYLDNGHKSKDKKQKDKKVTGGQADEDVIEYDEDEVDFAAKELALKAATKSKNGTETIKTVSVEPGADPRVVRAKKFALKPMSVDEACQAMDLLGHDFYLFLNKDSNKVCSVYHRRDSDYGLIEPEY